MGKISDIYIPLKRRQETLDLFSGGYKRMIWRAFLYATNYSIRSNSSRGENSQSQIRKKVVSIEKGGTNHENTRRLINYQGWNMHGKEKRYRQELPQQHKNVKLSLFKLGDRAIFLFLFSSYLEEVTFVLVGVIFSLQSWEFLYGWYYLFLCSPFVCFSKNQLWFKDKMTLQWVSVFQMCPLMWEESLFGRLVDLEI